VKISDDGRRDRYVIAESGNYVINDIIAEMQVSTVHLIYFFSAPLISYGREKMVLCAKDCTSS